MSVEVQSWMCFRCVFFLFLTDLISTVELFLARISIFIGQLFILRLNLIYSLWLVVCLNTFLVLTLGFLYYDANSAYNINCYDKGREGVLVIS